MWHKKYVRFAPQSLKMKWQMNDEHRSADAALLTPDHLILGLDFAPSFYTHYSFAPVPSHMLFCSFCHFVFSTSMLFPSLHALLSIPLTFLFSSFRSPAKARHSQFKFPVNRSSQRELLPRSWSQLKIQFQRFSSWQRGWRAVNYSCN